MINLKSFSKFKKIYEKENIEKNNSIESTVYIYVSVQGTENDIDNEITKWQKIGARCRIVSKGKEIENEDTLIKVYLRISYKILKDSIIPQLKKDAEKTIKEGGESGMIKKWDLIKLIKSYDSKNKTNLMDQLKEEIESIYQ